MNSADDTQTRLRVGGWLPPYQGFPAGGDPRTPPVVYRTHTPENVDTPYELSTATKGERRRSAVVFCAAVACLLAIGVALTQLRERPPAPEASRETNSQAPAPAAPLMPSAYVPATPSAAGQLGAVAPTRAASSRPPARRVTQQRPPVQAANPPATGRTTPAPAPDPTRGQTTPPAPGLRIDAPVSLELAGAAGLMVRHRDFRARVDRIGPGSSALDRADARFVVREGLADDDCVSFEASNYPGRFLRHRDFELRLDRRDQTRLFDQDATFCPEARGGAVALRSHNYPGRFVTESRTQLRLTGTATRFVVRPPL